MRTTGFGLPAACALILRLAVFPLFVAGSHHGQVGAVMATAPAPAGPASTAITCQGLGYAIAMAPGWRAEGPCAPTLLFVGADATASGFLAVERHAWWSDARSRSSITNDMKTSWTLIDPVTLTPRSIHGRRWIQGTGSGRSGGRGWLLVELETYADGFMYKFMATVENGQRRTQQDTADVASMVMNLRILPPRPPSRPAQPSPPPALPFTVQAWVSPEMVVNNSNPTLIARTTPGASCAATALDDTGRAPPAFNGYAQTVPASGLVSWSWHEETRGHGGTATVTCMLHGARQTATAAFDVTG